MLTKITKIAILCVVLTLSSVAKDKSKDTIRVQQMPVLTVTSNNAISGKSAVAFSDITTEQIKKTNTTFDLPTLMSNEPSVLTYSENGNGVGYSNFIMRGFDQRRISVMINGIPQNDPEDHNVYWINFSDIGESLDKIQIQRGAGLSNYGSAAIGGSINLTTSNFVNNPGVRLYTGVGFQEFGVTNTMDSKISKFKFEYSSGLVDEKYAFYGKLGRINSFGYREQSWALMNNYFLSAVRFDGDFTTQINIFGGSQDDALAYNGLPKSYIGNDTLRLSNLAYFGYDSTGKNIAFTGKRISREVEQFQQPHYEMLNNWKISDTWEMKSSLFYYSGEGYFDYTGDGWTTSQSYGFGDTVPNPINPVIRSFVGNRHGGWIPRFINKHDNGELTIGAEIRFHRSEHWGKLAYSENFPSGYDPDYKFYTYDGNRDIYSAFAREQYAVTDNLILSADAQLVLQQYAIGNETFGGKFTSYNTTNGTIANRDKLFQVDYLFLNPRFGANYRIDKNQSVFGSISLTNREPRMANLYDATFAFSGNKPLFASTTSGTVTTYDFNNPLVKPERMFDLEFGYSLKEADYAFDVNLYYMSYSNELVKNGRLDAFGNPIDGNAPSTYHAGIELAASYMVLREGTTNLKIAANYTQSINKIVEYNYALSSTENISLKDNDIAGFPSSIASFIMDFNAKQLNVRLNAKYVGEMNTDNFGDLLQTNSALLAKVGYAENKMDSYFVMNMNASYLIADFFDSADLRLQMQVNNLLNRKYAAYAIGKEFFPAAERNIFFGIQLEL